MFYLRKIGGWGTKTETVTEDEFGWWIGDHGKQNSVIPKSQASSLSSAMPKKFYINPEELETYSSDHEIQSLKNYTKYTENEKIELSSLETGKQYMNVDLIEKDTGSSTNNSNGLQNKRMSDSVKIEEIDCSRGHCYTPERLVRSQAYRILTPSPSFVSLPETLSTTNILMSQNRRQKVAQFINNKFVDTPHLSTFSDDSDVETEVPISFVSSIEDEEKKEEDRVHQLMEPPVNTLKTLNSIESIVSIKSRSQEKSTNRYWEDMTNNDTKHKLATNNILNVRTNGCDSSIFKETIKSGFKPCDELSMDHDQIIIDNKRKEKIINEVVTILNSFEDNPDYASSLLDEDKFYDANSSHDDHTRLALTIEPDGNVPAVIGNPNELVQQLRGKVEKLEDANKEIYKEIWSLKKDFQNDEWKVNHLSVVTSELREDIHEMRYLDDLLSLLQGELERISRRDWPFALRHTEHQTEEINLVI